MKIRILVVDDTIFYRKILSDILETFPDIEVVGSAVNGQIALSRINTLKPDLLTLDIEMPVMNGLELLEKIQEEKLPVDTIMISSKTQKDSEATMMALELGAFDFIAKPDEGSPDINKRVIRERLSSILRAYRLRLELRKKIKNKPLASGVVSAPKPMTVRSVLVGKGFGKRTEKSQVVAIGVSTGGPNALVQVIPKLPADIGVPVFLVQHMPPLFTASLAKSLDLKSALTVKEAENGETVEKNVVYIAPGGKQMKVASDTGMRKIIRITDDLPENNCKPSVDFMLRSIAREYGSKATCVIMTGMGSDGKLGVQVAKAGGAVAITQSEETCVVYGMPKAVAEAGLSDLVASLEEITPAILKTL